MNNCTNIGVQQVSELPIDNLESMPDYLLAIRTFPDKQTGEIVETFTRVPGEKIFPYGNLDNKFSLVSNNPDLKVGEAQVLPVYVLNQGIQTTVMPAGGTNKAMALAVQMIDGNAICQNCGTISMLGGHDYIVGQQYYLSNTDGQVTTDAGQTGQKLFIPLSRSVLSINM